MKKTVGVLLLTILCFLQINASAQNSNKPSAVINHVALYVVDLQKSGDFYMNVVGLDSIPEPFHDGKHLWLRMGPKASMHIIEGAAAPKEYYKNNHTCFSVSSVEAFVEILKKRSMAFEDVSGKQMAISSRPDGIKQIWLRDPDGYWIEINDAKD